MNATPNNPVQGAQSDIDCARDHLDTGIYYLTDAVGYLDGARKTRATEILDHAVGLLADLDRIREAL